MGAVSKTAKCTTGSVRLELIEAMELSNVLDYLYDWLHGAGPAVHASLYRFSGDDQASLGMEIALTKFSNLLTCGQLDGNDCQDDLDRDRDGGRPDAEDDDDDDEVDVKVEIEDSW